MEEFIKKICEDSEGLQEQISFEGDEVTIYCLLKGYECRVSVTNFPALNIDTIDDYSGDFIIPIYLEKHPDDPFWKRLYESHLEISKMNI